MQLGVKVSLVKSVLAMPADPAVAVDASVELADGSVLQIAVAAEASRSAADLATAIVGVLPAKVAPVVSGDTVQIFSQGMADPASDEFTITNTVLSEYDTTMGLVLAAGAGGIVGYKLAS